MISVKKLLSYGAAVGAVAASIVVVGTTGTAYALNTVPCDKPDYMYVFWHSQQNTDHGYTCYANAGYTNYFYWVDELFTGNNVVTFTDADGQTVTLGKYTDYHPGSAFRPTGFTIH